MASFVLSSANARWSPQFAASPPEVQNWFKQQHNPKGEWCCDEGDGHPYYGDYTIRDDGSVIVELDGKPHEIPKDLVLQNSRNPTGHAVWWFTNNSGIHRDYCFAPGTLS